MPSTKIVAQFSNGHTRTYQGRRAVGAAWMVVRPDGEIRSGFSWDRQTAQKTASTYTTGRFRRPAREGGFSIGDQRRRLWLERARAEGFDTIKAYDDELKRRNEEFSAGCRIEVIDI